MYDMSVIVRDTKLSHLMDYIHKTLINDTVDKDYRCGICNKYVIYMSTR